MYWYFQINAQLCSGQHVRFNSQYYNSMEKCFEYYLKFDANVQWKSLKLLQTEKIIFFDGIVEHENIADNGTIYIRSSASMKQDIGINREEFETIKRKCRERLQQ